MASRLVLGAHVHIKRSGIISMDAYARPKTLLSNSGYEPS